MTAQTSKTDSDTQIQCGLRPARENGPRVEAEIVDGIKMVHSYGHAGAG